MRRIGSINAYDEREFFKGLGIWEGMVGYLQVAKFAIRAGSLTKVISGDLPEQELMSHPYRFDTVGSRQNPSVVGVFQIDCVLDPFTSDEVLKPCDLNAHSFRTMIRAIWRIEDRLPSNLIHIGYDPETAEPGILGHMMGDHLNRVRFSPYNELPDFSRKEVDISDRLESSDVWALRELTEKRDLDPDTRQILEETFRRREERYHRMNPYGLTFLEYAKLFFFKDYAQSILNPQKN